MSRDRLLGRLGERIRTLREERGWSRAVLARAADLSTRFLAELEGGTGNISIVRLQQLADALGTRGSLLLATAEEALEPVGATPGKIGGVITLLGLRGAGKSTIGAALAARLGVPFIELDQRIEQVVGLAIGQIFELHGERYFRRLEREALSEMLRERRSLVTATGGGIVTDDQNLALLRSRTTTVWLKAQAREHWDRVVAQGDRRPMANRLRAMEELQALLAARAPLYSRADVVVDTSKLDVAASVQHIISGLDA